MTPLMRHIITCTALIEHEVDNWRLIKKYRQQTSQHIYCVYSKRTASWFHKRGIDMSNNTLAMIKYWRKSLIDGAAQTGQLKEKDFLTRYKRAELPENGLLNGDILELWQKYLKPRDYGDLFIVPLVYKKGSDHTQRYGYSQIEYILPLYIPCTATADGQLSVAKEAVPAIPRNVLEPIDNTNLVTISSVDAFTEALNANQERFLENMSLDKFLRVSMDVLHEAAPDFEQILADNCFIPDPKAAVLFEDNNNFITYNIRNLYDCAIRDLKKPNPVSLPLLDTICNGTESKVPPSLSDSFTRRLGYANNQFSLADNQRLSAACLLELKAGELLAVNGPPGTGKTSMLLSLVATEFILSALNKAPYPPIIFASSTNNQAVTNILADFAKIPSEDGIYKRWLPKINSFGSYYPSDTKKPQAIKDGLITVDFFQEIAGADFVKSAKETFMSCVCEESGREDLGFDEQLDWIHRSITDQYHTLLACYNHYNVYDAVKKKLAAEDEAVFKIDPALVADNLNHFKEKWEQMWQNRSFVEKYLSWLPIFGRKVAAKKTNIFEEFYPEYMGRKLFDPILADMPEFAERYRIELGRLIKTGNTFRKIVTDQTGIEMPPVPDFSLLEADGYLDASLRRRLFWLSVHYWEGQWIKAAEQRSKQNLSAFDELAQNWRMRMMLTPCAVSTFHRLPALMQVKDGTEKQPAYGLIDLLISEESGQVAPEVAGVSFCLTKRAVVVGDTLQIEPIWSVSEVVDRANAKMETLDPHQLKKTGHMASSGSVMKMAQSATAFSSSPASGLNPGLYLVEHRRCLKEIISYCNYLCYAGVLIPKKNGEPKTSLPPMYGLHVSGQTANINGSRANDKEAEFIANWLASNCEMLRKAYAKDLSEIIGIVTPFKAQANLIDAKLKSVGLKNSNITVGTVHSLQGAEREVIIFSPVYTNAEAGSRLFFNSSANMLNVAVSRAKENFIVIGDMRLIASVAPDTPYGRLFGRLKVQGYHTQEFLLDKMPEHVRPNCWLAGAEQHDNFLSSVLAAAEKRVVISSPWIVAGVVEQFKDNIQACLKRGVELHVVTDSENNSEQKGQNGIKMLELLGVHVHHVPKFHAKQLFCDSLLCVDGSFNWLSASRTEKYRKIERSFAQATNETNDTLRSLCMQCGLKII
ncbi:hypothetical protein C4J81_01945 [Deltaproteobacteria bacterium Smac51]|nr:hypothetical protein C4J81_01945 [Deltaproteobacteria bacterium Smac51]